APRRRPARAGAPRSPARRAGREARARARPPAAPAPDATGSARRHRGGRERQPDRERRAAPGAVGGGDGAAVRLDELPRDGQPEPHAGTSLPAVVEGLEGVPEVLVAEATAVVDDSDAILAVCAFDANLNHARRRMPERVLDQVRDDLAEPSDVEAA